MKLRRFSIKWVWIAALSLGTACSAAGGSQDAAETLQAAITGLASKDNFAFDGVAEVSSEGAPVQKALTFEGLLAGRDRLYIRELNPALTGDAAAGEAKASGARGVLYSRANDQWVEANQASGVQSALLKQWNPIAKLSQLDGMKKTVARDTREPAEAGESVLNVTVDPADMKKLIVGDLREQQSKISVDEQIRAATAQKKLGQAELAALRRDLQATADASSARFEQMVGTLDASGTYRLWVNRTTKLPRKLIIQSTLKYTVDGAAKEEALQAAYEFKDYDKQLIIPQQ